MQRMPRPAGGARLCWKRLHYLCGPADNDENPVRLDRWRPPYVRHRRCNHRRDLQAEHFERRIIRSLRSTLFSPSGNCFQRGWALLYHRLNLPMAETVEKLTTGEPLTIDQLLEYLPALKEIPRAQLENWAKGAAVLHRYR